MQLTTTMHRLQLIVWLCAGTVTDRLWAASRRLAHWTATHARRAELRLAIETETTWNAELRDRPPATETNDET